MKWKVIKNGWQNGQVTIKVRADGRYSVRAYGEFLGDAEDEYEAKKLAEAFVSGYVQLPSVSQ